MEGRSGRGRSPPCGRRGGVAERDGGVVFLRPAVALDGGTVCFGCWILALVVVPGGGSFVERVLGVALELLIWNVEPLPRFAGFVPAPTAPFPLSPAIFSQFPFARSRNGRK